MIIQCDHCRAKFRMDDSKLANGPVKVRCAKCKEIFVVQKAEEPAENFQLPTDFEVSSASSADEAPTGFAPEPAGFGFETGAGGDGEFSFNMEAPSGSGEGGTAQATAAAGDEAAHEFDWKDSSSFGETEGAEFDLNGFSPAAVDKSVPGTQAEGSPGEFDFGDIPQAEPAPAQPATGAPVPMDDFAVDFGEVSFSDTPAAESAPSSFDFSFETDREKSVPSESGSAPAATGGSDDFVLSFDADTPAPAEAAAGEDAGATSFGDFDFGEVEEPSKQAKPAPFVAPAATGVEKPASVEEPAAMSLQEELPPSSLTTRKKRGSLFPFFVIIGAILLIVALAGSGVYLFGGPKVFSKVGLGFLVEWYGQKGGEEGEITLRNIKAEYVINKEAGELFIVRGEALNNYKKPRASIQVKVALLGSGGSSLKAKTAFCGNSLSNEQLVTMPLAKIEEVMNNQFGDSLANLGVKPGNAIPFVVAVSGVPREAIDFSVQVGGSTVATQ